MDFTLEELILIQADQQDWLSKRHKGGGRQEKLMNDHPSKFDGHGPTVRVRQEILVKTDVLLRKLKRES